MTLPLSWHLLGEVEEEALLPLGGRSLSQAWATEESQIGRCGIWKCAEIEVLLSNSSVCSLHSIMPVPAGAASMSASDQAWVSCFEPPSPLLMTPVLAYVSADLFFTSPCSAATIPAASRPSPLVQSLQRLSLLCWLHCVSLPL